MAGCWTCTKRIHHNFNASPAPPSNSSGCFHPPSDSCSFYADCLETRYHCGPAGYPLGFGEMFCTKFQAARATLSASGQTWMLTTMHCLQVALVPDAVGAMGAAANCIALEHKGFATHADCYVHSGICKLPPSDWEAVLNIVDIKTLFDSWDALRETLTVGTECLELYAFLAERSF
ncbi:hypothetical protein GGX14DRAFT_484836 [Mycena pura]|uniref:Uncharacterized protein n=1 Tax=Mycena pura TaxID=153505 RepID=A0AAD6UQ10_9AGAR|nr:hypothetical protein GGX14DRAFT_484836 [Mycena pura]